MNFTFEIVSPKYGAFSVTAPERFRKEIEARAWCVSRQPSRAVGRDFVVQTRFLRVDGHRRLVTLHRFIWDLATKLPTPEIDHRDGQPLNNSEDNLRAASKAQNGRNTKLRRNSTSGVIGVCWHKGAGKWMSHIQVSGKRKHLGLFESLSEAQAARDDAAIQYHKDFATLNKQETAY